MTLQQLDYPDFVLETFLCGFIFLKTTYLTRMLLFLQVFGAIRQAVQRAPLHPESHNLNGLVCEAQSDYQSAVTAYRHAKCALAIMPNSKADINSHLADVSFNLARSLCKVELGVAITNSIIDLAYFSLRTHEYNLLHLYL